MTTTPHGQVPEALIDLIDAYAETRHRCGGIYNARTEAARKAVIEALSGVQALSAAPNGWESVIDEARSGLQDSEPSAFDNSGYRAFAETVLDAVEEGLSALAASSTPPAEQQAVSSAVLKAIREANMQLVRTGDDAFMLVPYKVATTEAATPKAGATAEAALGGVYAELPRAGAIGYASVVDVDSYVTRMTIGPRLPGVRDIALWTTDQLRDFADRTHALRMEQAAPKAAPESFLDGADVQDESSVLAYYSREAVLACITAALESVAATKAAPGEWTEQDALGILNQLSDGPFGQSDVDDALDFMRLVDTARRDKAAPGAPIAWTPGPNPFKDWCTQWFGPDSDDDYLAKAVFNLPPMAQVFREAAPQQEHASPISVGWGRDYLDNGKPIDASAAPVPDFALAPQQEAQEPVAWQGVHDQTDLYYTKPLQADVRPLYAAPQPAPDCHHRPPCDECAAYDAQGGK